MNNDASEAKPSERKASDKRLWCKLQKIIMEVDKYNDANEAKPSARKASDQRLRCKLQNSAVKLQRASRSLSEQVFILCFPCEHVCKVLK